jgi:Protein of unknown function (DUF1822)
MPITPMNDRYLSSFTIDLDRTAHATAAKFAAQQISIAKGRSVYLNTLAVCAVRQYLSMTCQLDVDLDCGDSWQVGMQSIMNVADLVIPHVGKVECLAVLPNATEISLPVDLDDRIGYIIVQFNDDLDRVKLCGFIRRSTAEVISIDSAEIQSIDTLLDLIYSTQILGTGWEPIIQPGFDRDREIETTDAIQLRLRQPEFALRNTLNLASNTNYDSIRDFTASKMINLRANISSIPLLMMIGLSAEPDGRVKVRVRIHAAGGVPMLPAHLKLTLQAENGQFLSEIQYPEAMNFIQLQSFKLHPGTQFKIRVALDNSSFTESFVA